MLSHSIFQDWNGLWIWEVSDEDGVYLRSDRSFMQEHDARENLISSTHLVRSKFSFN